MGWQRWQHNSPGTGHGHALRPPSTLATSCTASQGRGYRSALLGPPQEGGDVPHGHVAGQGLHPQVPVVGQQHHLPEQADGVICKRRGEGLWVPGRSAWASPSPGTLPGQDPAPPRPAEPSRA